MKVAKNGYQRSHVVVGEDVVLLVVCRVAFSHHRLPAINNYVISVTRKIIPNFFKNKNSELITKYIM
jgi:hypothetical protein